MLNRSLFRRGAVVLACALALLPFVVSASSGSFIGPLKMISTVASTVPGNGDVNPYGVAVVKNSTGMLVQGNVLVSNFNNSANLQGTGTTIVQVAPNGMVTPFAALKPADVMGRCPGGLGLTTALVELSKGWVVVGSLPTTDGTSATAQAGCLIVLNNMGKVVETFMGGQINGPWDMTAVDMGSMADLFVSNVLNGTVAGNGNVVNQGTVVRIHLTIPGKQMPHMTSEVVIGSGFPEKTDPAALVIGPTGLGFANNMLFVADTLGNRIASIPNARFRMTSAGKGMTVTAGKKLNGPLGLAIAPNGDILTVNSNDGNIVETTRQGSQIDSKTLDSATGAGSLFGLAIGPDAKSVYFVDDGTNTLNLLH